MNSLQLTNLANSMRGEVIEALQKVADEYGLSYVIDEDGMTIALPKYDEVDVPVVAKLDIPLEEHLENEEDN